MKFFSIKSKLIIAFLFVAIIPLSILSFHNLKQYRTELLSVSSQKLLEGAQFTSEKLNTFIVDNLNDMNIESQFPSYCELILGDERTRASIAPHLLSIMRILERREYQLYIHSYLIMDSKGVVILSINPGDIGKDFSSYDFFKKAFKENYSFFTVEAAGRSDINGVFFSSPVRGEAGVPLGVACIKYNFEILSRIVSVANRMEGEGAFALLQDSDGRLITSSGFPETRRLEIDKKDLSAPSSLVSPISIDGIDYFGASSGGIVQKKWTVKYIQPADLYLKPVQTQFNFMLVFNCVVVFIIALLAYFIGRKITAPVVELTDAAAKLSLDELDTEIKIKSDDEIGVLARTFNQMAKRLKTALDERKKTETEIIAARDSAEKASKIKSQFLANMSHELRTPMNGIMGFANMLQYTEPTGQQKEFIDLIKASSEHLLEIINDILDISKIESGKLDLVSEEFDLRQLVDQIIKFFMPHFSNKSIDLILNYPAAMNNGFIGDPIRIKQILMNILSNSLKFTRSGSVELSVMELPPREGVSVIKFIISDTGIGISEDKIPEIFNMFYQIDSTTTKSYQGTGLGLSIVKELVTMMNGNIYVESRISAGSKFTVDIELAPSARKTQSLFEPGASDMSKALDGVKMKLLLVDDDMISHYLMRSVLQGTACSLESADNGREALEKISNSDYDIVLLDIQMPEIDGLSVIKTVRERELTGRDHLYIIVISAYAAPEDIEKFRSAGADDFMSKPIDFDSFYGKLKAFYKAGR